MENEILNIPHDLEVHPLGDNGEVDVLPASKKNLLSSSQLPCGLPPILPSTKDVLNSFLQDLDSLPIFQLDAVQKLIPMEPNISSLYSINLCPLQTTLSVKRNMMTGKLLGFTEEVKDIFEGTYNSSCSLSRAPGPPEAGVKGSSSGFPFWPGGMDENVVDILKQESLNTSLFEEEFLDTPPGFKSGMKFEKKVYDKVDFIHSQPQKIYLSDVLAMDDMPEFGDLSAETEEKDKEEIDLQKVHADKSNISETEDAILKIASLPVLKISESEPVKPATQYDWAVIENVNEPVDDFYEKIPKMALSWEFELDIFQKRAILHLEKKENVFVAAHTSAGKTVVAEYAIALAKKNVTRVIYTSPIKALSNQKFRDFKEKFEDVGLITGDVQKNPTAFCLIMTTEILRSMLYHGSDVIRELEWVIFDEVHYINDSERGVVWEEVFIMLPDHVNLIMLSATVPNTAEFAEWLGGIKKRNIYVISTSKRPVPLEYFLYTGSVGKFEDEIFPVLDRNGKFLEQGYTKALNAKREREKSKASSGPKGPKYHVSASQEKNVYIGLLKHLEKKKLMPAVIFTFSRKRCNNQATMLKSQDLTTKEEKGRIVKFFRSSISNLRAEDQQLPQVLLMGELLERGFGVHHSGILPILKEIVEMLVKEKLVKVLFATETFAMGVNMPARTVVFDSIRKHDGLNFRDLQPSEFIQMAGRAGRRGLDETGTVILLCKGDVPDIFSLKNMMLGKPTKLESQFKLTYSMILNLLKIRTFRVEDVMKRSFGESDNQREQKKLKQLLNEAINKLGETTKPACSLCEADLSQYIASLKKVTKMKEEVMVEKCALAVSRKIFVPGRIIAVSFGGLRNIPCVLLSVEKENRIKILIVSEKKQNSNSSESSEPEIVPWSKKLFYPHLKKPEVIIVSYKDVDSISNKTIKIQENDVLKEWRRMDTLKCEPGHSLASAFQDLCAFSEANLNGFPSQNLNFKDMNIVNKVCEFDKLENSMENFTCLKCPKFSEHFTSFSQYEELADSIREYRFKLSEESLSLHPEYNMRKDVLKNLGYIDAEENVQLKGSVAREMSNHELLITELLVKSVFNDCEPEEVAALLSCMVFQQRCDDEDLELPSQLKGKVKEIKAVAQEISHEQFDCGINEPHFVDQYNFHLVSVVYEWAKGTHFANIMQTTDVDEGIIVRSIQRLSELLKDVRNGATLIGETVLAKKMDDASHSIKRDIVFAASLYTQ